MAKNYKQRQAYLHNFEALDAVGGNAFQLKQTLPEGTAEIIKLNTNL